jgi:hypothetical protein
MQLFDYDLNNKYGAETCELNFVLGEIIRGSRNNLSHVRLLPLIENGANVKCLPRTSIMPNRKHFPLKLDESSSII